MYKPPSGPNARPRGLFRPLATTEPRYSVAAAENEQPSASAKAPHDRSQRFLARILGMCISPEGCSGGRSTGPTLWAESALWQAASRRIAIDERGSHALRR